MSNYTKATNFASKDTLPTGDAGKIVKGTEIDTEFNAISSAISSKADTASPTFTGTPAAPTATTGANTTQVATTAFVTSAVTDERTATATLTNKTITSPIINQILHEGTANDFETTIAFTDPTVDRTITFPDKSGTVAMTSELSSASALYTSSGTYSIAGTTSLVVTATAHGRAIGDIVYLSFTTGTAVDGYFNISAVTTNTFTVTYGSVITTSGNLTGYFSNLGTISIASTEETLAGSSTNRAVSPAGVVTAINTAISDSFVRTTSQATTSGTSFDFIDIPSGVKRITVMFNGVSLSGTDSVLVQLGDAGGIETTGYIAQSSSGGSILDSTSGFPVRINAAANTCSGIMTITNFNSNIWVESGNFNRGSGSVEVSVCAGSKTLSDVLTQLRITTTGSNTFDAGSVNIMYE